MTMISDLSQDLLDDIFSRIPLTSLRVIRSTCKRWNDLSKDRILCKAEANQLFIGFILKEFKVFSAKFNVHDIFNEDGKKLVNPSIKEMSHLFNQVEVREIIHCDGLLLCVIRDYTSLVVWNPYLGQIKWIEPVNAYKKFDMYAFGHDNNKNRNHKILRIYDDDSAKKSLDYQIYDFKSNSWRVIDATPHNPVWHYSQHSASLKGNTYFLCVEFKMGWVVDDFLICFDFTSERFGQHIPLPSHYCSAYYMSLSSVREEHLTVLYDRWHESKVEIWVTTKIEPNAVSWSCFSTVDVSDLIFKGLSSSLFIDQEKKSTIVIYKNICRNMFTSDCITVYIIGEGGYSKKVNLGRAMNVGDMSYARTLVCSYVPSLVEINQGQVSLPL
ncbi:PREDICTED: putative F-box protein At3g20030 [Camelina sativa]|uniref:F-box protein At3g20030 n=1 Tax=Camelina sativa TaxID=90675 RepID=A0ABM0T2P0_CAMSA|nr:PREDICTED: putative F-box protein At3g20030 [Camelina sativa]